MSRPPTSGRLPAAASRLAAAVLIVTASAGLGAERPSPEQEPAPIRNQPAQRPAAPADQPQADGGVHFITAEGSGMRIPRTPSSGPKGQWWLPALDFANSRYSQLDQITTENAENLKVETTWSTGINRGHEGQPLVVGNTMYVVTPFPNYLLAFDMTKPGYALKWKFEPHPDPTAVGKACCDVVNRGAAYADGKIVYNTLDNHVVAVNAETGKLEWMTKVGNVNEGETMTMAPIIVKDKVIAGNSGAELGVRGWVKGLDLKTGEVLWTAYNTGPDEETLMTDPNFKPYYAKDQGEDLGVKSWPPDQWELGGSTVWGWISYDPELDLIYYGTGNPGVWNPDIRPGANKWSLSIIARNPDTGQARWAYQLVPHEAWDYDEIMENILIDMPWNGEMRKLLVHPGRTGFMYVIDRTTGELLSAEKYYQHANWATGYDLQSGLPQIVESKRTHMGQTTYDICPASTGAKEVFPSAISPRTGYVYIPAENICMNYAGIEANYIAGTPYLGADVLMYPGPGGYRGNLIAWNVAEAREVWSVKEEYPLNAGVLATAGDVIFYGTMDGWFKAVDAHDGEELWKFKVSSGIVSNPMTYTGSDGRQYVAVYAGIGGWLGANAFETISADDPTAALGTTGAVADLKKVTTSGGTVYVFALPQS